MILNLVEAAETDIAAEHQSPRGSIRISVPLSFGLRRAAAAGIRGALSRGRARHGFQRPPAEPDRGGHRPLDPHHAATRPRRCRPPAGKQPHARGGGAGYLARHGRPLRPADLSHHEYLGYTNAGGSTLSFLVDGQWQGCRAAAFRGNNGEVLVEAAVQGMGITAHPDFIVDPFIADGRVEEVLADFPLPELGIYAMPGQPPGAAPVCVLIDFLAAALAASLGDLPPLRWWLGCRRKGRGEQASARKTAGAILDAIPSADSPVSIRHNCPVRDSVVDAHRPKSAPSPHPGADREVC